MTRRHGRCARGARLVAKVPHGRWRTVTFLAALRHDRIAAPCVIDGPINGPSFAAYIEQFQPNQITLLCAIGAADPGQERPEAFAAALQNAGKFGIDPTTGAKVPTHVGGIAGTILGLRPIVAPEKDMKVIPRSTLQVFALIGAALVLCDGVVARDTKIPWKINEFYRAAARRRGSLWCR